MSQQLIDAVNTASQRWKEAFNAGDAAGCAAQYEPDAVMHARPIGTFTGTQNIQAFWQNLIQDGFAEVEYIDPLLEVLDDKQVLLTSHWKMNKAKGVIHKELWKQQPDGTVKLREDDFEVQAETQQ
ncbi:MAG: nuclear transport factor 2 family protein [Kistimonas sp.]|nr:nuclear transport factor 2 family protein [Kistimonas sp.]